MSIRETSIKAWRNLNKRDADWPSSVDEWEMHLSKNPAANRVMWSLSAERLRVYLFLSWTGDQSGRLGVGPPGATGRELNDALNSQSCHKRLSELVDRGLVRESAPRTCEVTKRQSIEWIANHPSMYREPTPKPKRLSPLKERDLKIAALEAEILSLKQEVADLKGHGRQTTLLGLGV